MSHVGVAMNSLCYSILQDKTETKKDQEKAKREHRRVTMAVGEFLKVNCNIMYN